MSYAAVKQNYINHIAVVLDASSSMAHLAAQVIKVADGLIAHLARRSQELDQETRVSIYIFNNTVRCVIFDKDVLRLPSIAQLYGTTGRTALIDATIKSQADLATTSVIYGDHAFLTYIITDGEENESRSSSTALRNVLDKQANNWTVAVFVPNQLGRFEAQKFGFPADNIAIWDATTAKGMAEVGETITRATDSFMAARATGVRGSKTLFSMGADTLNARAMQAADLKPLNKGQFFLFDVDKPWAIREFVEEHGITYEMGLSYYQLTKPELVQARKAILVRNKVTGVIHSGANARSILGLPNEEIRIKPEYNAEYDVYVQSTSVNRKLVPGTRLIVLR